MQVSFIASISNILRPWKTTQGAFWKALAPLMTKTEGEGSMGRILKDLILFKRLKVRKGANFLIFLL